MIIPFAYEHFNNYLQNRIKIRDLIELIKFAFTNSIDKIQKTNNNSNNSDKKYYQLNYNTKQIIKESNIICCSSKIVLYHYLLFKYNYHPFYSCIDYYINNNENRIFDYFDYNINNIVDEPVKYYDYDNIGYIDLMDVFDKFFNQHRDGFTFKIKEMNIMFIEAKL
jgi:hypothetical protein